MDGDINKRLPADVFPGSKKGRELTLVVEAARASDGEAEASFWHFCSQRNFPDGHYLQVVLITSTHLREYNLLDPL
jgi:hypothetical protein